MLPERSAGKTLADIAAAIVESCCGWFAIWKKTSLEEEMDYSKFCEFAALRDFEGTSFTCCYLLRVYSPGYLSETN